MQNFLVEAQNHEKHEHVEHMGVKGCEAHLSRRKGRDGLVQDCAHADRPLVQGRNLIKRVTWESKCSPQWRGKQLRYHPLPPSPKKPYQYTFFFHLNNKK